MLFLPSVAAHFLPICYLARQKSRGVYAMRAVQSSEVCVLGVLVVTNRMRFFVRCAFGDAVINY
jgi:hypothetical protein